MSNSESDGILKLFYILYYFGHLLQRKANNIMIFHIGTVLYLLSVILCFCFFFLDVFMRVSDTSRENYNVQKPLRATGTQ